MKAPATVTDIGFDMDRITISHGSGGKLTDNLIKDIFFKYLGNELLAQKDDSTLISLDSKEIAFTTDSFVIKPLFFPGGDIGKLAICGTVNDLAVNGAVPEYISCGFIIEEGFEIADLEKITKSMGECAKKAGVKIVCGDTKVVEKGAADGLFINTAGIGRIIRKDSVLGIDEIKPGDKIIITGNIAEHGLAVLTQREGFKFKSKIESDCAPLNKMLIKLLENIDGIKFMRDPTRGGVAATLNEVVSEKSYGILLNEENLPVSEDVKALCELLGFDPLYIANEGKAIIFVLPQEEESALLFLKKTDYGKNARAIGEVTEDNSGKVVIKTALGARHIIDMLTGEPVPRIC